jgi:hypothetical protein
MFITGMRTLVYCLILSGSFMIGCYSFRGISIPPDVRTYYVPVFEIRAPNAPPTIGQDFSEQLKDKVRNEARLLWEEENPDIEFTGAISNFVVKPVAPQPGETVALNRLEVSVSINFINHRDEKKNWNSSFSFFSDFGTDQNLLDIQDGLIVEIYDQIIEDIFNRAFTDW